MSFKKIVVALLAYSAGFAASAEPLPAVPLSGDTHVPDRPNIVLIVADDLGYSDIGAFGGEIATPNLDALAARGAQLTNFYVSPACSPTRAMLMTGRDNHEAGFGTMLEVATKDQRGAEGYAGHIPADVPTLPEKLRAGGYRTLMSGKWHLGPGVGQGPADRGFERSFALIQGAHNHFGADTGADYVRDHAAPTYRLNGSIVQWPEGGYSSDVFTNYLLGFLREQDDIRPFFAYLAFTAPHWPLQAPEATIAKYHGKYDAGPDAIARARIDRMKKSGLIAEDFDTRMLTDRDRWDGLNSAERAREARMMEVYAAMVEEMDANVGRLVEELRRRGDLDNTMIIFMSDNGPEGLVFNRPINPMEPGKPLPVKIDNSTGNLGAANSYFSYGPAWGQASAAPYWGTKEHVSEGGIRSASIVAGPGVPVGSRERTVLHVRDIFPTLMALTGIAQGDGGQPADALPLAGINMLPLIRDPDSGPVGRDGDLFWELFYRAAIRQGDLKAIYQPTRIPVFGKQTEPGEVAWQLYDLSSDPGEMHDLARDRSDDLERLRGVWRKQADRLGVVLLPEDR